MNKFMPRFFPIILTLSNTFALLLRRDISTKICIRVNQFAKTHKLFRVIDGVLKDSNFNSLPSNMFCLSIGFTEPGDNRSA